MKGIAIGIANSLPGTSGGTMAYILGIFEELNDAAGNLFQDRKKFLERGIYLLIISIGGFSTLALVARLFSILLKSDFSKQLTYITFIGLILGSVPQIWRNYEDLRINWKRILFLLIALIGVISLAIFAQNTVKPTDAAVLYHQDSFFRSIHVSILYGLWLFLGGLLASGSTLLPGFSGSAFLISLGIYYDLLYYMDNRVLLPVVLFSIGTLFGTLIFARIINYNLKRFPSETIYFMMGLLLASIYQLIMQIAGAINTSLSAILLSILCLSVGAFGAYSIGKVKR